MPKVEDIFSQLNGAKYFSTLDLRAGYHHIRLTADSIPKTAFTSPFGKYEYVKVPFGLAQAPAYFQELITGVLKDLPFAMAYLDDIIIYSSTPEEHLQHIKTVFEKLCHAKLSMKLSKSFLCQGNTIPWTHSRRGRDQTSPSQNRGHQGYAPTSEPKTGSHLPQTSGILQKIYQELCKNSKTTNNVNPYGH